MLPIDVRAGAEARLPLALADFSLISSDCAQTDWETSEAMIKLMMKKFKITFTTKDFPMIKKILEPDAFRIKLIVKNPNNCDYIAAMANPTPPSRVLQKLHVHRVIDHTHQVRELQLKFAPGSGFRFRAGQFVMLHVPNPDGGKAFLRAYSVASDERNEHGFDLLFKFVETGKASEFVWSLRGDEILDFTGPFGKVFFQEPPTAQIIMLNTGTGVAQHLSYLYAKMEQHPNTRFRMLFGLRTEEDIYFRDQLQALAAKCGNFEFEYVLSRPSSEWTGKRGYVQEHLKEMDFTNVPTTFYLCGNGGMIKDTKKILEAANFDKTKIWAEAFD